MLKIAQAALIGLHGVQRSCLHARSCLHKPACAGKSAVKCARVDGPLDIASNGHKNDLVSHAGHVHFLPRHPTVFFLPNNYIFQGYCSVNVSSV